MNIKDYTEILGTQYTGIIVEANALVEMKDEAEAKIFYRQIKERLTDVNHWHEIAGKVSSFFQHIATDGEPLFSPVSKGNYIRIDIPGPGSSEGDGFDWVIVEEMKGFAEGDVESNSFRVRPSGNPTATGNKTAHFYSAESTSNFIITREGKKINVNIIDLNVKPNDQVESGIDSLRHSAVGRGAINGFSKLQWQNLAEGLIRK